MECFRVENVVFCTASNSSQTLKEVVGEEGAKGAPFFYGVLKPEEVSAKKRVVLRDGEGEVYEMDAVELPKFFASCRIPGKLGPDSCKGYTLFVQSTSPNRKLSEGQEAAYHSDAKPKKTKKKRGRAGPSMEELRDFFEEAFGQLDHSEQVRGYWDKFGDEDSIPEEAVRAFYAMVQKNGPETSVWPIIHRPIQEIDMWGEEPWPFHNRADDFDPKRLGQSKFGGVPHLPPLYWHLGKRKDFVTQIDCSQLAPYDIRGIVPASGFMWLWHSFQYPNEHPIVCR